MKNTGIILVLLLLSSGCATSDSSLIKDTINEVFYAAQDGDLEYVIEQISANHPANALLTATEQKGSEDQRQSLKQLSKEMQKNFENIVWEIDDIVIHRHLASTRVEVHRGKQSYKQTLEFEKTGDRWLLITLPALPRID